MSESSAVSPTDIQSEAVVEASGAQPPAAPADDRNPAILDARKTFIVTVISAALFIGTVFVFIL
jgi:hypothetical protein